MVYVGKDLLVYEYPVSHRWEGMVNFVRVPTQTCFKVGGLP